ncbi:hypothetical protein KBY84_02670 [Cyanobium sp. N.Huapi 1H5]|uniref:hypothetical protein n=1 Tax=Cyanobium sp. N.Huapi 1H5 TaxID=2823719 RepID=UPI0020CF6F99|nr:hypothetical protein [Cyanobium sp. N.Huapi 1H5]MCP9836397.1 hypothetical protein [Cyanobium sp. N.Huapi 1H5]
MRDLHASLCRQKVEMLNSLGVIVEERLSSPMDVAKVAELNEKLSHIEAMQEEVYRKWQQPRDAEVELELDQLKRGSGNSDRVYGTGERGGNYEVRISKKGSVFKRYI